MIDITFPKLHDDWNLDVVNILAFLGEHNIQACSQQICMSWTCFLPRLIPAPQYFDRMLHTDGSELPAYSTRVLKIDWEYEKEDGCVKRRPIRPRLISPMSLIAILSCALSLELAAWALVLGDAVALTGILAMSFTTPLLCLGMRWTPRDVRGPLHFTGGMLPPDTIVLKSPNGSFTVVECDVEIVNRLYFHPNHIDYMVSSFTGRGLSGTVGGIALVGSIVLFGSAVWTIKAALAVTYTVLNLLYWIAAIPPVCLSWHIDLVVSPPHITAHNDSLARCLWTTIYTTKKSEWVREHIPETMAWDEWLPEAQDQALKNLEPESWDPQVAL